MARVRGYIDLSTVPIPPTLAAEPDTRELDEFVPDELNVIPVPVRKPFCMVMAIDISCGFTFGESRPDLALPDTYLPDEMPQRVCVDVYVGCNP